MFTSSRLGEVLTGAKTGRSYEEEVTLFNSIGVAIEDVSVAGLVYEKAVAKEVGTVVEM